MKQVTVAKVLNRWHVRVVEDDLMSTSAARDHATKVLRAAAEADALNRSEAKESVRRE